MRVQVAKWGNSTAVRLPEAIVRQPGLTRGMTLDWIVSETRRLGSEREPETLASGGDVGAEIVDDDAAQ